MEIRARKRPNLSDNSVCAVNFVELSKHLSCGLLHFCRHGVRHPELVIAYSAHAAYYKAAEYFKMRLVVVPVDKQLRLTGGWCGSAR
jgi:hypothetical protein